jgi:hypothetical protein
MKSRKAGAQPGNKNASKAHAKGLAKSAGRGALGGGLGSAGIAGAALLKGAMVTSSVPGVLGIIGTGGAIGGAIVGAAGYGAYHLGSHIKKKYSKR